MIERFAAVSLAALAAASAATGVLLAVAPRAAAPRVRTSPRIGLGLPRSAAARRRELNREVPQLLDARFGSHDVLLC